MKKIILLEFKRTTDYSEAYYRDMKRVKEKEWLESFRVFGIDKEDGKKILHNLGLTLLHEHEKIDCKTSLLGGSYPQVSRFRK